MKAILVIEHLPEQTDIKNLLVSYRVFNRTNKNHEVMKGAKGLRPMPEKKPNERFWLDDEFNGGYRFGWNDCIDAITGETDGKE